MDACLNERKPAVDIYEALAYTMSGVIAHESALKGGESMSIHQFDRGAYNEGKWHIKYAQGNFESEQAANLLGYGHDSMFNKDILARLVPLVTSPKKIIEFGKSE